MAAAKMQILELLYATFRAAHLETGSARAHEWHEFRAREGEQLRRHALFEALQEHFHRADPGVWGWPALAGALPRPRRAGRGAVLPGQPGRAWSSTSGCSGSATVSCTAQARARYELGLGVGLYGDLAVSIDRGGAEAWANQDLYALQRGRGRPAR